MSDSKSGDPPDEMIVALRSLWHLAQLLLMEVGALRGLLIAKGVVTPDELRKASADYGAGVAVNQALDPVLAKLDEDWQNEWRQMLERVRRSTPEPPPHVP